MKTFYLFVIALIFALGISILYAFTYSICTGGPGMCGPQATPQEKQARTYLSFPFDVTTDSLDNIYVADSGNDRIVKFNPNGNYMMQFGISGKNDGQFMEPRGVAVDSSGNIYVADTTNNRIEKFDPSGNFLLKFGSDGTGKGEFHGPYSIAVDKSDDVYVGDVGNARVQKFDSDGNFILEFGSRGRENGQFYDLGRVAVDNSRYVYVTDVLLGIEKFDSMGNYISKIPLKATLSGNNTPDAYGITLDNKGHIFVAGDNQARIQKFTLDGTFQYEFGSFGSSPGQFNHPGNIAPDSSGNILVADSDNNRVERVDQSGKFLSTIDQWHSTIVKNLVQSSDSTLK
jgi:DNA-binding beta-propeller fold protein YncE